MSEPAAGTQAWDRIVTILRRSVPRQQFETWFRGMRLVSLGPERAELSVPNNFLREWIHRKYFGVLRRACEESHIRLNLERERDAAERGARVMARVEAWERGFDPSAPAWGFGTGAAALANRLRAGLRRRRLDLESIGAVVSSAAGSRDGDALEAAVIRELFGDAPPPVFAPKGALGEYGGGHLAAAVLAAGGASFRTAGFTRADPGLGVVPHDGSRPDRPRRVLVSALATGGSAAWLVLGSP